jgi:hypothetical protein
MKSRILILMLMISSFAFANPVKSFKMENQVDKVQVTKWKAEHGGVYVLPVGDKEGYLREPKMNDFKRAFKAMMNGGDIAFGEELLRALWLDGDKEILEVDDYFMPARKQLKDFFEFDDAEIKTLKNRQSEITIDGNKCVVRCITREDLKRAEGENPSNKTFVTQEKLFDRICISKDDAYINKNSAPIRFPLYKAIEDLQNTKYASLKKL